MTMLTKRFCDTAPAGRHYDDRLAGFGLYVGTSGARSFFVEYRPSKGRGVAKRRMSLGKYGALTVQQARELAQQNLATIARGDDPLRAREVERRRATQLFDGVVREWLERDQRSNRSYGEVKRLVSADILPVLKGREITAIRKRDIVRLLDGIADRGSPVMANRTLAHIRRLFRWAIERDLIETDPTTGIGKRPVSSGRERVLDDQEIVAIWNAVSETPGPYSAGVRLLFLTGARRDEIFGATWDELDEVGQRLRLPAERSKIKQGRDIHLTPVAVEIVTAMPRFGPFIFTTDGRSRFSGFSKAKKALDEKCGVTDWRLHDIRRTVATGLQRLGVRLEVTETVLGHIAGSRRGVIGIYQRHGFEDEAREALASWGAHVEALIEGRDTGKVVPLRRV
ncbi:MAG: integrase arm-type DNA-binding domain-containing protein [Geminicoccaceae bacterium]